MLHYVANVLIRTNAHLILFNEEMPSLEAAARREHLLRYNANAQYPALADQEQWM